MAEYLDKDGAAASELEYPKNPEAYQRKWMGEIARAERYFKEWVRKGELVVKKYRKENDQEKTKRKFAMLWANTEVMKPTVYARVPEPIISRRFKDADPAGRIAGEMLERATAYVFEQADFDSCMKAARDDLLLPGRGTAWVRFVRDGEIAIDYVHWRDFVHDPARRWEEVSWVAKRSYFSKTQLKKRFPRVMQKDEKTGVAKLRGMSPDNVPKSGTITEEEKKALEGKYTIWELWSKDENTVCFLSPSAKEPLEILRPFLDLASFWPTPRPMFATLTTDSLIPVPDYKYYQDQAEEIDDLTRRIGALTDSLKLVGFYPKGSEASTEIEKALDPTTENRMIGVESWAAFSEKGGIKSIVFLPIEEVAKTITACVELRRQLIQDVYEITGISDIMRGATDPNETLGAQQLKAQTGSVRIRDRQQDIQRFARDILRIMSEIIAEKFSPTTLMTMTNMKQLALDAVERQSPQQGQQPQGMPPMGQPPMPMPNGAPPMAMGMPPLPPPSPDQQALEYLTEAFQLLKDDKVRGFRIDIETDSTVQPDEDAEKQRRIEFTSALGEMFKNAIPMVQQVPELLPLVGEALRFVTRGFRAGRQLEDVLDKTLKVLEQQAQAAAQAKQNAPPQPTKEQIDQERMKTIEHPKAQADIGLVNAQAAKTAAEAAAIPAKLAHEQDKLFLGESARQEERADNLDAQAQDRDMAETERQDSLQSEAADRQIAGMERGDKLNSEAADRETAATERQDALTQQGVENQMAQQAAQAAPGHPQARVAPGAMAAGTSPVQGGVAKLLEALAASTQQNSQAIQQLAQVMAAPTVVDTPRGRYVARKAMQ